MPSSPRRDFLAAMLFGGVAVAAPGPRSDDLGGLDARGLHELLGVQARGFEASAVAARAGGEPVFVIFDTLCGYCATLWQHAEPLRTEVRFVWIPVAILGARSEPQAAALLAAPDPVALMDLHRAGRFDLGTARLGLPPPSATAAVRANTRLFRAAGGRGVPLTVFRDRADGRHRSVFGALAADDLQRLFGRG